MKVKLHFSLWLPCLFVLTLASGFAQAVIAQAPAQPLRTDSKPLSSVLNQDGSVKSNLLGSFDPNGYQMTYGPKGEPRFAPAGQTPSSGCGDGWDSRFIYSGTNGFVYAIASDGAGNVYIGGLLFSAGNVPVNGIAKWDGTSWSALGSGVNGIVRAIAVSGTEVYVGGEFTTAGGLSASRIAKWNGVSWSPLGGGMNGPVRALAVAGSNVYAGGGFAIAGGVSAKSIAKWNGSYWTALGVGTSGTVSAIALSGSDVYAGGQFTNAGGISANHIAKWDGNAWSALGTGVGNGGLLYISPNVKAMTFSGADLWVAGDFVTAGEVTVNRVAKWDGGSWSAVGAGFDQALVSQTYSITASGSNVYVSDGDIIRRWDGTNWFGAGSPEYYVYALAISGGDLFAGGQFERIGQVEADNIAKRTGNSWTPLTTGLGLDSATYAVVASGSDIYVGGRFTRFGNGIAKWNGTAWSPLGSGFSDSEVHSIVVSGSDVYASNNTSVRRWNGTTWTNLGTGGSEAIAVSGTNVFKGGGSSVKKWNGITWDTLGTFIEGGGSVEIEEMVVLGSDLYVAGKFGSVNGTLVHNIAKWNGDSWSSLGEGLDRPVTAMTISGTDIYVGGQFTSTGNTPLSSIAKWNGSSWSSVAPGAGAVNAIAFSGSNIYAGSDVGIRKWNGTSWTNIVSTTGQIFGLATSGNDLFVAGAFNRIGCVQSSYFARYSESGWTGAASSDWHVATNWANGSVPLPAENVAVWNVDTSITSADAVVNDLTVMNGRTVTVGAGRTLTVNGKLNLTSGKVIGPGSVVITNCSQGAIYLGTAASFIDAPLTRCVNNSGIFNFPVGTGTIYSPIELSNVIGTAAFTVSARSGSYTGPADGLANNRLQRWWELTNSGITQADITFGYLASDVIGTETRYRAFRVNAGTAERVATFIDPAANRATARGVTSFSPWTLAEAAPAAASISGRITAYDGRGVGGALVTLTDESSVARGTVTNHFGYYRMEGLETERPYILGIKAKRYEFTAPQRVIELTESGVNVDFVSSEP